MEFWRIGDKLLRSRSSPLLFLVSSFPSRSLQQVKNSSCIALSRLSVFQRSLVIRSALRQASSNAAAAQAPEPEDDDESSQPYSSTPPPSDARNSNDISKLMDGLFGNVSGQKSSSSRTSNHKPMGNIRHPSSEPVPDSVRSVSRNRESFQIERQGNIFSKMTLPKKSVDTIILKELAATKPRALRTIHSRPSLGRTVEVELEKGFDVARALRQLGTSIRVNRVIADQRKQRFHERPGLKRKRLKSERWRRRFREGFLAVVQKVKDMRKKGW